MRTNYHKLVRDRIPEIIAESGRRCAVEELEPEGFRAALLAKLVEEAREAVGADGRQALVTELADLREVMDAVAGAFDITADEVEAEQLRRRKQRGSFTRRLRLLWTE